MTPVNTVKSTAKNPATDAGGSAAFTLTGISKTFESSSGGQFQALEDIDLTVREGEFLALLGPSGCGKSTLLEIMAGLQSASAGQVLLGGEPITAPHEKIGVVFQDPSLYPWRTVRRNVELGLEIAGVPKARRRETAAEYLGLVGLADTENAYPHQLSGGMRQRVGIARALANSPEVLLMDEPFGAVDHLTRLQLQQDLLDIWLRHRRTIVFVTHDVAEAAFLADRVVLLTPGPGRLQQVWEVDSARPRERDDSAIVALQNEIYAAINATAADRDARLAAEEIGA